MDEILRGTIVTPSGLIPGGWLAIDHGIIAAIGTGEPPPALRQFDAGASLILPGIIDGQTHTGSYQGLAGLEPSTRSAIAGGVTTIVDMPYDAPAPLNSVERLDDKIAAIERLAHCDVALYGTIVPGQGCEEIAPLIEAGIAAFKISAYEVNPTRFPRIPADLTLDLMEALADTSIPLGLHNEDQEIVLSRVAAARRAGRSGLTAHSESRPPAAELAATAAFLEMAAVSGAHAHIVHFSLARGLQLLERYRAEGVRATGELCVHYLWFDPAVDGPELGALMKVNPPMRPGQRDALWAEIAVGRVAFVSSDHSSWPLGNKRAESIFDAGAGVPGLETLLPAFLTGAAAHGFKAAETTAHQLSERPARFFGLWPRKGAIQVGADADIAIFTEGETIWNSAGAHDGLNWSPFDGRQFAGRVSRTYLRGELAWDGATIRNRPGDGRYLRRGDSRWFS